MTAHIACFFPVAEAAPVIMEEVSLESCEVLEEFLDTWQRCKLSPTSRVSDVVDSVDLPSPLELFITLFTGCYTLLFSGWHGWL